MEVCETFGSSYTTIKSGYLADDRHRLVPSQEPKLIDPYQQLIDQVTDVQTRVENLEKIIKDHILDS